MHWSDIPQKVESLQVWKTTEDVSTAMPAEAKSWTASAATAIFGCCSHVPQ